MMSGLALFVLVLTGLFAADPARAKQVAFRHASTPFFLTVPDDWSTKTIENGLEITSPSQEVMMWVQAIAPQGMDAAMDDYIAYYEKQGIETTGELQEKQSEVRGVPVTNLWIPANWKGRPTVIRFLQVYPVSDSARTKNILVGLWTSPASHARYNEDILRIMMGTVAPP